MVWGFVRIACIVSIMGRIQPQCCHEASQNGFEGIGRDVGPPSVWWSTALGDVSTVIDSTIAYSPGKATIRPREPRGKGSFNAPYN